MKKIIIIFLIIIIALFFYPKEKREEIREISSPVLVSGKARGYWFFEGSFPIRLEDEQGNLISLTVAEAQGDWMTEDYVPFSALLSYRTTADSGVIVFQKDNPSGIDSAEVRMPVSFKKRKVIFFLGEELTPLDKEISFSKTPIQDTIALLLKEIGLDKVELVGANLKEKQLTLEFRDPFYQTSGGSSRVDLLWRQIKETAQQFPEVEEVYFKPEELFQP